MNEEFLTENTVSEKAAEADSRENELMAALAAAENENAYLKAKCICAELGVPAGMTEDIICLGRFYAEKDGVEFEEAARTAFGRISASGGGITTGIAAERTKSDCSALRRAFGLKG